MTGEGAHGKSNSPKTQRLLQALGTPIHALTVLCVAIVSLLLLALAIYLNSRGNSAPRIVLKPYLDLRAGNVSTPERGHSDWLREVPEHPESASERLARGPHDLKPGRTSSAWPKIFVYHLPKAPFKTSSENDEAEFRRSSNYAAEMEVPDTLLRSEFVTEMAEETDYFFVDAWFYNARLSIVRDSGVETGSHNRITVDHVVDHIQSHYSYWNANGGKDHIFIITQDHGYCGFQTGEDMSPRIEHSVKLVHWALMDKEILCDLDTDVYNYGCWGRNSPERNQNHLPCFVPGRDTAIASTAAEHDNAVQPFSAQVAAVRDIRLFFSGGLSMKDVSYSHGVRQTMYMLFNNTPGFRLTATDVYGQDEHYMANFGRSLFCIAATGAGWGVRLTLAVMHGCIPVVIADHVQMPYEDVLPYPEFAVHLREHALYRLPEVLDQIIATEGLVQEMQQAVGCVWRYFTWRAPQARALDALICSLRRKLTSGKIVPHMNWTTCTLTCDR